MYKKAEIVGMRAITPVHAGCASDLGIVDLPIQRERQTGYPKVEASGLKGCIREQLEDNCKTLLDVYNIHNMLGYDRSSKNIYIKAGVSCDASKEVNKDFKEGDQYASAIGFVDARILVFPVISAKNVFAYVTCPDVIDKFIEALNLCEQKEGDEFPDSKKFKVKGEQAICSPTCNVNLDTQIILDNYRYDCKKDEENIEKLAKLIANYTDVDLDKVMGKLVIVSDTDFQDYVSMNTEVITRTKINNETGTVAKGALFTEEYLPAETIMYSMILYSPVFSSVMPEGIVKVPETYPSTVEDVKNYFKKKGESLTVIQIGGGATIGKGIMKFTWGGEKP